MSIRETTSEPTICEQEKILRKGKRELWGVTRREHTSPVKSWHETTEFGGFQARVRGKGAMGPASLGRLC